MVRNVLKSDIFYYLILIITIIYYLISINVEHKTIYQEINNEKFTIIEKTKKDYGIKLVLKGKEKIIGYIYLEEEKLDEEYNKYELGDEVLINGKIKELQNNTLKNTFNYKKYLYNQKIYNQVSISEIKVVKQNKNIFYKVKNILENHTKKLEKSYPYVNSLILGNNDYLDEDVANSYRNNGISHLFAISGTHISIFIGLIYFILKRLKLKDIKKHIITILFLIFYMFLTNFSMSVLRASIFTILLILNKLFKTNIKNINLLILTLFIIVLNNPLNINNIGLQFSISISFYLIMFSKIINNQKNFITKTFITSYIAFLVSLPILINNFYQVNFLSVIYNIFFVPYVSFILLPFTIISFIFPFLDSILYVFIKINEEISLLVNNFTFSIIIIRKLSILLIIVYYILITLNFIKMKKDNNKYNLLVIVFILLISINIPRNIQEITFIDVGQGDSTLMRIDNKTLLIDTGGTISYNQKEYKYNISKNKILPYMKSLGIKRINFLILTHGDADHMKEAKHLVENFKVDKVIFNCGEFNSLEKDLIKVLNKKKIRYYSCIKELIIGDNKLQFLNNNIYDNENDNSSVVYTELNNYKFLFMGDAGVDVEISIIEKYDIQDIDVLKVGHHGSSTSSSEYFIDIIKPKYSVISAGKNNRFGHPRDEVLKTLENSKVYRTDEDGSIMFKIKNNKLKVETWAP